MLPLTALAADAGFTGMVVAVSDGDTIHVLTYDKEDIKIRLKDIDAPEKGQPYGQKAKQALSDICYGQRVRVDGSEKDRYGRFLGRVYRERDGLDVNATMVGTGNAWVYRKYSTDASLLKLEEDARNEKRGLWILQKDQVMPPWEWRRVNRAKESH